MIHAKIAVKKSINMKKLISVKTAGHGSAASAGAGILHAKAVLRGVRGSRRVKKFFPRLCKRTGAKA